MRWVRILSGVIGIVAVVMAGVVVFVATLDLNAYKGDIEAAVEDATGRALAIEGEIDLAWTPRPTLTAARARLANAPWGSRADMVAIGALEVSVELLPLLGGQLDMRRVALSDVGILLERDAEGRGNWQLPGGADGGGGFNTPLLGGVELNNITVHWKPGPDAEETDIRIPHLLLASEGPTEPLDITVQADLDGDALALVGTVPPLTEVMRPGATLPVELQGNVADLAVLFAANLRYTMAEGGSLGSVDADRMSLSVGPVSVRGRGSLVLDGDRPRVTAKLESDHLALPAGGAGGGGDPLEVALPFDLLSSADASLSLTADRVTRGDLELSDLAVDAALEGGILRLEPVTALLSDGRVEATAVIDATESTARHALSATWTGANFGKLARDLHGSDTLETSGDAALDLTATGASGRDMLASLSGIAWITTGRGRIANEDWELIAEDLTGRFLPFLDESSRGTLNCAVGRWTLRRGVAETRILMIDSDRVTIAGEGSIDLARETLDMTLSPSPKDASLLSLATPLVFTGSIHDPDIAPDPVAVAKGVGSIVAGTALTGPVALLLPFISTGSDEPPCEDATAIAVGREAMPSGSGGATREQDDKPGGIKGLFDSIRRAVE